MTSREALREICNSCEHSASLSHQRCPFRSISNDFCDEYEQLCKDLEILEILKKYIRVTESKSSTDLGNYITSYGLDITVDGLDFIQFDKIREWLKR